MPTEQPFEIRGAKIPLFALQAAYADLLGGNLDRSKFTPWSEVIKQIRDTGANNVTLIVSAGVMSKASDSFFDPTLSYNPDLQAIRKLADLIKANGMGITIDVFPHIANVISGDGSKLGGDRPYPTNAQEWMQNFSKSILEWARFSEEIGATTFIPFGDTTQHLFLDSSLTDSWLNLIGKIRQNFSGTLTSNWWTPGIGDSITSIPSVLIQKLDYLGVGFFPNLTKNPNASTQELIDAYHRDAEGNDLLAFLQNLHTTYNKPIWITDKAFHSFDGAAFDEARIFNDSIPLTQDLEEQARLYDSFLFAVSREGGEWLKGVSFQSFNNIDDNLNLVARFVNGPLSESPQGKPALQVMSDWFNGLRQGAGLNLTGSSGKNQIIGGYLLDTLLGGMGDDTLIGAAGDDVLISGPEKASTIENYVVDISLRGVPAKGISPTVQVQAKSGEILLNASVSGIYKAGKPSTEQVGESTHLLFNISNLSELTLSLTNWAFVDFSDTGNRFVHLESVKVNGVALDLSRDMTYQPPTPYISQIGRVDAVHGGKFVFNIATVPVKPEVLTASDNDVIYGGTGQDTITGGFGDDWIDGGKGLDTAIYSGRFDEYKVTRITQAVNVNSATSQEKDTLINVERLRFSDKSLALDLDGNAGSVAKILGAVFGANALSNAAYVGIGLNYLDKGMSYSTLMQLAIDARLGGRSSNSEVVNLLYTNVVGNEPDAATLNYYKGLLDDSIFTQATLGVLAADTSVNAIKVNLVGLTQTGIQFIGP